MLIRECWELYLTEHLPKTHSLQTAQWHWNQLDGWFGDREHSSPLEVEQYIQHRLDSGVKTGTIRKELGLLKSAIRHNWKRGRLAEVPYIPVLPITISKVRSLSKEEASLLLRTADGDGDWRPKVYIRLALSTGARPEAIMKLKWDQVDLEHSIIDFRVTNALSHRMKRRAVVPINEMCRRALDLAATHRSTDYVLGETVRSSARKWVTRIAIYAGLKNVTPNVLRHTVASLLLQDGVDLLKVSRLLGHSSSLITQQVYFQHQPTWLKETTSKLKF